MADTCTITWNPNYSGASTFTSEKEYGSSLGTLPVVTRPGYSQNNWWTASSGGSQILTSRTVNGAETYYAHWNETEYNITYNLNGGNWNGVTPVTKYRVTTNTFNLATPTYSGRSFIGWSGSNGNTPQLTVTIAKGTIGNKSYVANWNTMTYVVKFNKNSGTARPESMEPQTFTYDVYQQLRANVFSDSILVSFNGNGGTPSQSSIASYREFQGWATSASGNKAYNDQ